MFYYKIPWFYQDFRSKCFLNLYSVHAARVLDLLLKTMLSPTKRGTKHLYNSNGFSFMQEEV